MYYGFYRDENEEFAVKDFLRNESKDKVKYKFIKGKLTKSVYDKLVSGYTIVIYDLSIIDNSTYKIIDKLKEVISEGVTIFVISPKLEINSSYFDFLYSMYEIEKKGITQRINKKAKTVEKLKEKKKPIKTKPSKSMFDKHKRTIFKLYNQTSKLEYILKIIQEKDEKLKNATIQGLSSYIKKIKKMEAKIKDDNQSLVSVQNFVLEQGNSLREEY